MPTKPVWGPNPETVLNDKLNQMVEYSEQIAALSDLFGQDVAATVGLQLGIKAGRVRSGATITEKAASTLMLSPSAPAVYVEIDSSAIISQNTVGWTTAKKPLFLCVTDAGSITSIEDQRVGFDFTVSGGAGGVLSGSYPNPDFAVAMATQAELDAHAAVTDPHGATSAATASRLVLRDASGRAQFADPATAQDAATKNYVDTALTAKASLTGAVFTGNVDARDLVRIVASGAPVPCVHWVDEDVTVADFTGVGFSPNLGTNTVGRAFAHSGATGGFNISGFSASSVGAVAMTITGHHGSQTPNVAPLRLQSYKHNGTTGRAAMSGSEPLVDFYNGTGAVSRILGNGSLGVGVTSVSAILHLAAGSAAVSSAPQKFTSGPFQTVAEPGAKEYNGRFALVESDATRRYIVQAVAATKTTAAAPYANDGYVELTINGVTIRVMTTA